MKKFETLSALIECSSGVVPKTETIKSYIDILASFGYDRLYLGLADAYKIKSEPRFNYKRGGYTTEELKDMDDYAKSRGVELVAQIHILSHLHFLKKYPEYFDIFDTDNVLLVGENKVYKLIDEMLGAISEGISSRRIHLGLDEAFGLGTGEYFKKHGYADKKSLILKHLKTVFPLLEKYGYTPEMWGDMLAETEASEVSPQEIKECLPKGTTVFLWNYEEKDEKKLAELIDGMKKNCDDVAFAGAAWKYLGFGPNNRYSVSRIIPQMMVSAEKGIKHYMVTLWSDRGAPCSNYAALPALFIAAEYNNGGFSGEGEPDKTRFEKLTGENYDDLSSLEFIDNPFRTDCKERSSSSFWAFYTDILLGNFDTLLPEGSEEAYARLAEEYENKAKGRFSHLYKMTAAVARVLSAKVGIPAKIRKLCKENDKAAAKAVIGDIKRLKEELLKFEEIFDEYFLKDNNAFGLEIHHLYNGGQAFRLDYAIRRLTAFIERDEKIEETEDGILPLGYEPMPTVDCSCMTDLKMLISYCIQ